MNGARLPCGCVVNLTIKIILCHSFVFCFFRTQWKPSVKVDVLKNKVEKTAVQHSATVECIEYWVVQQWLMQQAKFVVKFVSLNVCQLH